jgi:hypothetical protein
VLWSAEAEFAAASATADIADPTKETKARFAVERFMTVPFAECDRIAAAALPLQY